MDGGKLPLTSGVGVVGAGDGFGSVGAGDWLGPIGAVDGLGSVETGDGSNTTGCVGSGIGWGRESVGSLNGK